MNLMSNLLIENDEASSNPFQTLTNVNIFDNPPEYKWDNFKKHKNSVKCRELEW